MLSNNISIIIDLSKINRFDEGSDNRLLRAKVEIKEKLEKNKLITQQRFLILNKLKNNTEIY